MLKYLNARVTPARLPVVIGALTLLLITSGCGLFGTHKKVQVPPLLPMKDASRSDLVREVNRLAAVKSIHGKLDIQFEDTSFASVGIAEKYRQVDGNLTLQRPGGIYLTLQFTIVEIAQMASDGQHFAVAVLQGDERYRRFVKGTNNANYPKLDHTDEPATGNKKQQKGEKETVNALSNLRPQHLTDAFLIRPIDSNAGVIYSQSEFFQEEPDTRPQKKGSRVMRGYYLLEELSEPKNGETQVLRRFWFDRVDRVRLARLQTFDSQGQITTDVSYFDEKPIGATETALMPTRIELTRPKDQYKLSLAYQDPASVELNREYPPQAFILQNKWGLPEVDLDAEKNKKVTANQ